MRCLIGLLYPGEDGKTDPFGLRPRRERIGLVRDRVLDGGLPRRLVDSTPGQLAPPHSAQFRSREMAAGGRS